MREESRSLKECEWAGGMHIKTVSIYRERYKNEYVMRGF